MATFFVEDVEGCWHRQENLIPHRRPSGPNSKAP
jgi:hypothetical protein